MRTHPKKWTKHHTHRIAHISLMSFLILGAIGAVLSMFLVFGNVQASEIDLQNSSSTTLHIGPVESEPAIVSGGGFYQIPAPEKPPVQPYLNIDGANTLVMFSSQYPHFQGVTNIKNAEIFLQINTVPQSRVFLRADSNGQWSWTSPQPLMSGDYELNVQAIDSNNTAITAKAVLKFQILPNENQKVQNPTFSLPVTGSSSMSQLGLLLSIPIKYKNIIPGDDIVTSVEFLNFPNVSELKGVLVEFVITDSNQKIVFQQTDSVDLKPGFELQKTFHTSKQMARGNYTLTAYLSFKNTVISSNQTFVIRAPVVLSVGSAIPDYTPVYKILTSVALLFTIVAIFEYDKIKVLSAIIKQAT